MNWPALLFDPTFTSLVLLVLSLGWMLKDETDRTRPLVVMALVLNCFYGPLLGFLLGREDSMFPWKYDHYLHNIDASLGLSSAAVALAFAGPWSGVLTVIYQLMVPMMIFWCALSGRYRDRSLARAYVVEMVAGPLLYAVLPACGPAHAFGANWLHPPVVEASLIRFNGMPNAFPSLHLATALLFVLSARTPVWKGVATLFFTGTALATLTTGEHYVIDLVAGAAFGCFASLAGNGRVRFGLFYLAIVFAWLLALRFGVAILLARPALTGAFAVFTVAAVVYAVWQRWQALPASPSPAAVIVAGNAAACEAPVA